MIIHRVRKIILFEGTSKPLAGRNCLPRFDPTVSCHAARGMELTISVGRERVEDSSVMRVVVGTFHRLGSHYFRSERVLHPEHMLEKNSTRTCVPALECARVQCALHSSQLPKSTKKRSTGARRLRLQRASRNASRCFGVPFCKYLDNNKLFLTSTVCARLGARERTAFRLLALGCSTSVCGPVGRGCVTCPCLCHLPDPKRAPND